MGDSENSRNTASSEQVITIYISDFWRGFVKFWWVIVLLAFLCGGFMFYRSYVRYSPRYQASVTFAVHTENPVLEGESGLSAYSFYYNRSSADHLAKVFPYILQSNILQKQVCEDLNLSHMPASVSATCVAGSNLVTLTTTGSDPQTTYDVLASVLDNYSTVAEYIIGKTQLVMITEPQVPTAPYNSSSWKRATLIGLLFGLGLGVCYIVLYCVLRRTIRTKEDIVNELNQHCIGVLPYVVFKRYKKQPDRKILITNPLIGNQFLESVRLLRSTVQNSLKQEEKVIVVTSSAAGEGKSVTTLNLASMFAKNEMRILVIDGDLRNSGICELLSLKENKSREATMVADNSMTRVTPVDSLGIDLLRFDCAPEDFHRILRTSYLRQVIDEVRKQYDLILIDTPPCGLIADAALFASVSDAVLYVIRQDYVMSMSIRSSIHTLLATDARLIGCVFNGVTSGIGSYGYNYGYGYSYYGYKNYRYGGYGYGESRKRHSRKKVEHEKTK